MDRPVFQTRWITIYSLSSSSSSDSSLLIWKYLSSRASLADATTLSQSLRLFFLRYFLVRYLRYLLEKGMSEVRQILVLTRSITNSLPKLLVLPPTLILSCRYFSKSAQFMMPSSTGWVQSMNSLIWFFFPSFFTTLPLPFRGCFPGFLAAFAAGAMLPFTQRPVSCRSESSNKSL